MNEELQRELVSILRAMKDGSPEAFKVLVEQRSLYCWANVAVGLMFVLASVVLALVCAKASKRLWYHIDNDIDDATPLLMTLISAGAAVFAFVVGESGLAHLPEALAPLGRVLEVLR